MTIQMEAVYENGVFRPLQPVPLAEHQRVTVTLDAEAPAGLLPLQANRPPLRVDEGGAVRVGDSRISLDLVVEQCENGMTPEDMVPRYDRAAAGRRPRRHRVLPPAPRRSGAS